MFLQSKDLGVATGEHLLIVLEFYSEGFDFAQGSGGARLGCLTAQLHNLLVLGKHHFVKLFNFLHELVGAELRWNFLYEGTTAVC